MAKTVQTPKGTALPLTNLKGKDYLMVGYRLQWFNEEVTNFDINTEFLLVTEDQTIARSVVTIFDDKGAVVKRASATKRETRKDFPDHTEKAETSSIGRALAMLGYGTQFALADLDEGDRIVDSPVVDVKESAPASKPAVAVTASKGGFGVKNKPAVTVPAATEAAIEGWE